MAELKPATFTENLASVIYDEISSELVSTMYDLKKDPKEEIRYFIEQIGVTEELFKTYKEENNDFWNDKNDNGDYWCDLSSEWADSQVEICNSNLWDNAEVLQDYIMEAQSSGLAEGVNDLMGLFQIGEYEFYSQLFGSVLNAMEAIDFDDVFVK